MTQLKYILVSLIFVLLWNTSASSDSLPALGEPNETLLTPRDEKRLGKEFMEEVHASTILVQDPVINNYVENLGNRLLSQTNTRKKKFHFFVVHDPIFNAFAGPDAHIGINSGTIITANTESELAAVMAHEIAHVTQHHIARLIKALKNTQITAIAGILAAAILASTTNIDTHKSHNRDINASNNNVIGNLTSGIAMATLGGATQHIINFTRSNEIEADHIGMEILYQAAFDPQAMPDVFERAQKLRYDYTNDIPKFLLTHPVTNDRIAEAKNRASQLKYKQPEEPKNSSTFALIRARTLALTTDNLADTKKTAAQLPKDSVAMEYYIALCNYKKLEFSTADKIIRKLQKNYPNEVLFQMLAAQIAAANKQGADAINTLQSALRDHSNYLPLTILYAQTLLNNREAQIARDFLQAKIRKYQDNSSDLYRLLARAYAANNQIIDAYQARAKAYTLEGYYHQAIILLQQTLRTSKLSNQSRSIINAKIDQIKKLEKEEKTLATFYQHMDYF